MKAGKLIERVQFEEGDDLVEAVNKLKKDHLLEGFEPVQGIPYDNLVDMLYEEASDVLKFGKKVTYTDDDGYKESVIVDGQLAYIGTNTDGLIVAVFDVFDFESGSATLVYEVINGRLKLKSKKEQGIITYPKVYKNVKSAYGLTDILLK